MELAHLQSGDPCPHGAPEIHCAKLVLFGDGECMSTGRSLYRLNDAAPGSGGCVAMSGFNEAWEWSARKWGVFWTVNEFDGDRKKENLKRVLSFAVDLDGGDKETMRANIRKYITPSATIETKNGYHVYYDAQEGVSAQAYEAIVGERLVPLLGGDKKAKDVSRILRVPGFCHWKNPEDPFGVRLVQWSEKVYSEQDMMKAFPLPKKEEEFSVSKFELRQVLKFQKDDSLAEKVSSINCEEGLKRLSGRAGVNHEMFSFKQVGGGKKNILVNGKNTSCWIDREGRIGSADGGGPTIWQWINWYQRDHEKTFQVIKDCFPEVLDER